MTTSRIGMMLRNPEGGFTLIELAFVACILALLMMLSASSFRRSYAALSEKTTFDDLLSLMDFARQKAILERVEYGVQVAPERNAYWLVRQSSRVLGKWGQERKFPSGIKPLGEEEPVVFFPDGTSSQAVWSFSGSGHSFTLTMDSVMGKGVVHEAS